MKTSCKHESDLIIAQYVERYQELNNAALIRTSPKVWLNPWTKQKITLEEIIDSVDNPK